MTQLISASYARPFQTPVMLIQSSAPVFPCVCLCPECRSAEAALVRSSLCAAHCFPKCLLSYPGWHWGVTPACVRAFKDGPVSRLKIAGLRMRTGGFPACEMHCSVFFIFLSVQYLLQTIPNVSDEKLVN